MTATIDDPAIAKITRARSQLCGAGGPGVDCRYCGLPGFPACPGGSGAFSAENLPGVGGPNLCLGDFSVLALSPGETFLTLTARVVGETGLIETTAAEVTILVGEGLIFADGFESGDTRTWSGSVGASPFL